MSNIIHKIKDTFKDDNQSSYNTSSGGNPYGSNKPDPRADSDRDYRATGGVTGDNYGNDSTTSTYGRGSRSTNEDPYGSNVSNKQDSGVDGDIDYRNRQGGVDDAYSTGQNTGTRRADKYDTRVDSGTDNSARYQDVGASGTDNTYTTPGFGGDSGVDNSARYQDDSRGGGNSYSGGAGNSYNKGSGGAQRTVGPHDSNLLNKLDPRVDSDQDGSRTVGGNYTNY